MAARGRYSVYLRSGNVKLDNIQLKKDLFVS